MTQRKYQMRQRAAAVEETRKRILEATSACHRERGMLSTGMEDVAERAGVAIGTVYRHFPTLEHLIGACGAVFMTRFALPDPDEVPGLFRGSRTREARLTRLIDEVTTRYQGGAIGFIRIREAKDELEPAAAAHETVERSLDALATEAARLARTTTRAARPPRRTRLAVTDRPRPRRRAGRRRASTPRRRDLAPLVLVGQDIRRAAPSLAGRYGAPPRTRSGSSKPISLLSARAALGRC
jgi:AcrR family transcriptional regulator